MHSYFERHEDILASLVQHFSYDSILEVLMRVMHGDDSNYGGAAGDTQRLWVTKTAVVQQLVDGLGHGQTSCDVCPNDFSNAAEALCSIAARTPTSPLLMQLFSEESIQSLIDKFTAVSVKTQIALLSVDYSHCILCCLFIFRTPSLSQACDELAAPLCIDEESKEPTPSLTCDSKPFGHKSSSVIHILTVLQRLVMSPNSASGGTLGGMGMGAAQAPTVVLPSSVAPPSAASHVERVLALLLPNTISNMASTLTNSSGPKGGGLVGVCATKVCAASTL
jgi:hypothetical protein